MSKLKFSKGRFARFISSRGFYVALAVCLAGAGVATYMAVDRTINVIQQTTQVAQDPFEGGAAAQVEQRQPGVPLPPARPAPPPAQSQPEQPSQTVSYYYEELYEPTAQLPQPQQPAPSPRLSYVFPVRGDIIQPFSDGELVRNVTMGDWRTHDGIDIQAAAGTEIHAAADGVVQSIRVDPLWGTVIVIEHADGYQTHYSGLARNVPVSEGESVSARQAIGQLEGVPSEMQGNRVHLHFAVKRDGAWVDPMLLLQE